MEFEEHAPMRSQVNGRKLHVFCDNAVDDKGQSDHYVSYYAGNTKREMYICA